MKIINWVTVFILSYLLVYTLTSFITLEFDIFLWTQPQRSWLIIGGNIIFLFIVGTYYVFGGEK